MTMLSEQQQAICEGAEDDFSGLKAVLVNATLKPPSQDSHTDTLLDVVAEIFETQQVSVDRF